MGRVFYSHVAEADIDKIVYGVKDKRKYKCVIPYSDRVTELLISRVLSTLLSNVFQDRLHQNLEFIANELIMNACKANAKRVYFRNSNLDIENKEDYEQGMNGFFSSVYNDFNKYKPELKDKQYYIKVEISITDESFNIEIENNSKILKAEMAAIESSIVSANKFESLNEIFSNSFNTKEGVGYGLILVILMLRRINVNAGALKYITSDNNTITSLSVPLNLISDSQGSIIAEEIIKEINELPQFPDSILRLQKELNDPECNFHRISELVISDSSLSAEVLRIANSPIYMPKEKIDSISDAVKRIGLKGLNSILYNYGASKVLEAKYSLETINNIKEHLFSVAIVSSYLATYIQLKNFTEDIFVAALLHDIGKIIVNSLNRELSERISTLCIEKNIPSSVLDSLCDGYNHTVIGAALAKKWNFPEKYINAIKYHHNPMDDDGYYKSITYCVYMGNEINHYLNNNRKLSNINTKILDFFNLKDPDEFKKFISKMKSEGLDL